MRYASDNVEVFAFDCVGGSASVSQIVDLLVRVHAHVHKYLVSDHVPAKLLSSDYDAFFATGFQAVGAVALESCFGRLLF